MSIPRMKIVKCEKCGRKHKIPSYFKDELGTELCSCGYT